MVFFFLVYYTNLLLHGFCIFFCVFCFDRVILFCLLDWISFSFWFSLCFWFSVWFFVIHHSESKETNITSTSQPHHHTNNHGHHHNFLYKRSKGQVKLSSGFWGNKERKGIGGVL